MKVVAFICNLSKGGAQGVFVNVVNYIYEAGIEIEVVVQSLDDAIYKDEIHFGIPIKSLGSANAKTMLPALKTYLQHNELSHALVFGPEIAVNLYLMRKLLRLDFKIVGRCLNTLTQEFKYSEGFFRKYVTSNLIRALFHKVDVAIAQSQGMADDLIANWGFQSSKVVVINNALQPAYEHEAKTRETVTKDNYIMFAGRLEKQKGLEMLLNAFSQMHNREITLKIIGSGSMKAELEEIASRLQIDHRVEFLEHTPFIMQYYKKARAMAMTSYFEGFPNVLVEAIACGTPVVSFDLPSGPKEIIMDGENGFLVPYLDVKEFAKALDKTVSQNWNADDVKATAFRYMRENIIPKYIKVLEDV